MPTITIPSYQQGGTLGQIAGQYKTTVDELMRLNPQITNPDQIREGGTLNIPSTQIPIIPTAGTPAQSQTGQPPTLNMNQFQTGDPIRKFNLALLDMLKKAQTGQTQLGQEQAQLKREAYTSGQEVFTGEEAKMTPQAKMAALQRNVEMYEPSVQAATIKIEQLGNVMNLISKTYGEDYKNLIPATKEDAAIFQKAMASGWTPPADIVERYGKFFTTEDWNALVEAQERAKMVGKASTQAKAPATVKTDEGTFQYNPASGFYDIRVGGISTIPDDISDDKVAVYQDSIDLVNSLKENPQISAATGLGFGGGIERFWHKLTGETQQFIAGVEQIVSQFSLNALIEAKSRGATFGALSEGEMRILASSATKLGTWAVRNKAGKVTGYNIDEESFKTELDEIIKVLERNQGVASGDTTLREQVISLGYDYDSMINQGYSDEEIKQSIGL